MRTLLRLIAFTLDVLLLVVATTILVVSVTGGGEVVVGRHVVSIHSLGRPIALFLILACIRHGIGDAVPILAIPALTVTALSNWTERALVVVRESLTRSEVASSAGLCIIALAAFIKTANAYWHVGFFSGDDVEIQEMTFAHLFGWDWHAWELRSAFYPMVFIFPIQALLVTLGRSNTATLVFAGRLVVVLASTVAAGVLYRLAKASYGTGVAVLATLFFALSKLHVTFGGTELPRPVATLFVLLGFAGLTGRYSSSVLMLSSASLGVAAALRFSEVVFLVPAFLMVWRDSGLAKAAVVALVSAGVATMIQAISDMEYWGSPFFSARHILDYTVVKGLSTRGYQSTLFYLSHAPDWTNWFVIGMAIMAGWRRHWRPALWLIIPMCLLSLLPHKEPRYLIPILPFLSLLAAFGLWEVLLRLGDATLHAKTRAAVPLIVVAGFVVAILYEARGMNFQKSDDAVRLARILSARHDVRGLAVEQIWRLGSHLYLPAVPVLSDIPDDELRSSTALRALTEQPSINWIAVLKSDCPRSCERSIIGGGYRTVQLQGSEAQYAVFQRQ